MIRTLLTPSLSLFQDQPSSAPSPHRNRLPIYFKHLGTAVYPLRCCRELVENVLLDPAKQGGLAYTELAEEDNLVRRATSRPQRHCYLLAHKQFFLSSSWSGLLWDGNAFPFGSGRRFHNLGMGGALAAVMIVTMD